MAKKKNKAKYRLHNWADYNKALVQRGSLSVWIGEEVLSAWHNTARTGRRGKPASYANTAILCMATVAEVYRLPPRAAEGLTRSVVRLLGIESSVVHPHF